MVKKGMGGAMDLISLIEIIIIATDACKQSRRIKILKKMLATHNRCGMR
jgi:acyl CoA:acetate/3-ketoacid CoA transferase beta subunit